MKIIKLSLISIISFLGWLILFGPIQPYFRTLLNNKNPQLVFILGGDLDREASGLKIAKELNLPIIISSGSNPEYSDWMVKNIGVSSHLLTRDYTAKDTLSNFTTLINRFSMDSINHALLITSEYHISRAMTIGRVIAGSKGIKLTALPIPCTSLCKKETKKKEYIDLFRSLVWVMTQKDVKAIIPQSITSNLVE